MRFERCQSWKSTPSNLPPKLLVLMPRFLQNEALQKFNSPLECFQHEKFNSPLECFPHEKSNFLLDYLECFQHWQSTRSPCSQVACYSYSTLPQVASEEILRKPSSYLKG